MACPITNVAKKWFVDVSVDETSVNVSVKPFTNDALASIHGTSVVECRIDDLNESIVGFIDDEVERTLDEEQEIGLCGFDHSPEDLTWNIYFENLTPEDQRYLLAHGKPGADTIWHFDDGTEIVGPTFREAWERR